MKHSKIKSRSSLKVQRDKCGSLHFKLLKLKRDNENICEICGQYTEQLGRFHILPVGGNKKLEFEDKNVLLAGWYCCHFYWHHDAYKAAKIRERLKEILPKDYEDELRTIESTKQKHDMFYLKMLEVWLQQEIEKYHAPIPQVVVRRVAE